MNICSRTICLLFSDLVIPKQGIEMQIFPKQVVEILKILTPPCHVKFKCPPPPGKKGASARIVCMDKELSLQGRGRERMMLVWLPAGISDGSTSRKLIFKLNANSNCQRSGQH